MHISDLFLIIDTVCFNERKQLIGFIQAYI